MWRRRLALACVLVAAACSGYSSSNGGEAPDGGGAQDASPEGATPPPGPGSDAGADGPWCFLHQPDASICDDFDEPGTLSGKWNDKSAFHATEDVVDDEAAVSPPRVLLTTTDGTAPDVSVADLTWHVASATTVAYGFSLRFDHVAVPTDGGANDLALFQLSVTSASGTGFVTLKRGPGNSGLNHFAAYPDGGTIYGRTIAPLPPIDDGKWHEVVVRFSLVAPRAISIAIDGAAPKEDAFETGFDPGAIDFSAAITFAVPGNDGWKIAFDDVWLDAH